MVSKKIIIFVILISLILLGLFLYITLNNSFKIFTHQDCVDEPKLDPWGVESWTLCHYNAAKENNDLSICLKYFGRFSDERDKCLYYYAINKTSIDVCDRISRDYYGDDCYLELYKFNPEKACNSMNSVYKKGVCLSRVKGAEGDLDYCETEALDKDACYYNIGVKLNDPSGCDIISDDDSEHHRCLMGLAQSLSDLNVCDFSRDISGKDNCLFSASLTLLDSKGCLLINGSDLREQCIRRINS